MKTENINGFIWAVITNLTDAVELMDRGYDIYIVRYENNDESLLRNALEIKWAFVVEFGFVGVKIAAKEELTADYNEEVWRNNENRTFEDWCLSKIE